MQKFGIKRLAALAGIAGSLCVWGTVANALTVSIGLSQNGGAISTVASGDGLASFTGAFGNFSNTINAIGIVGPTTVGSDLLTSSSINVKNTGAGSATLDVYVTEQGLTAAGVTQYLSQMATNLGGSVVSEATYIDAGNGVYALTTPLASHVFATIASYASTTSSAVTLFSLTERFTLNLGPSQSATSSIDVSTTPVPAALPLMASVLGGGFMFRKLRRRKAA